jgi:hypothetical protein
MIIVRLHFSEVDEEELLQHFRKLVAWLRRHMDIFCSQRVLNRALLRYQCSFTQADVYMWSKLCGNVFRYLSPCQRLVAFSILSAISTIYRLLFANIVIRVSEHYRWVHSLLLSLYRHLIAGYSWGFMHWQSRFCTEFLNCSGSKWLGALF